MSDSDSTYEEFSFSETQQINGVPLSVRTANALINNGITTFAKLISLSDADLLGLHGLGRIGYLEIQESLLSLSEETIQKLVTASGDDACDSSDVGILQHIRVDEAIADVPIEDVYFSKKTRNALISGGILTLGDLSRYTYNDLLVSFQGMGQAGAREVGSYLSHGILGVTDSVEFHEFVVNNIRENQRMIFDRYYGLTNLSSKSTLEEVASEFGLTRERVRQINKAVLDKIGRAIRSKIINPDIEFTILEYVNSPVQEVPELSDVYHKRGVLRVYLDTKILGVTLYKNYWLKSEWIIDGGFNIEYQVNKAVDALKAQIGPVKINELADEYSINEKILYDINKTTISDGLIVLNTNKRATGNDLIWMVGNYMDKTVRPVTVSDIAQELNISTTSARGLVWRVPGAVNVGLSTYALEKYGYSNNTTAKIAEELLEKEGQPVHIDKIISYVTKYRLVNDGSVPAAMSVASDIFSRLGDGYYALRKWGYESVAKDKYRLEVPAKEAVLDILSRSGIPMSPNDVLKAVVDQYGDKSTNKTVTVSSVLVNLYKKGVLIKLGTDSSPFYLMSSKND